MNSEQFIPEDVSCYIRPVKKRGDKSHKESEMMDNAMFRKLGGVADDFMMVMESLLQYARQGLEVSHNSMTNNLQGYYQGLITVLKGTTKKHAQYEMVLDFKGQGEKTKGRQYVVPIQDLDQAFKVGDYLSTAIAAPRILCNSLLQQFVNTWEGFVGKCLSVRLEYQKKLINNKLTIPYESIRNLRDVSDVHRYAIEQTVGEVLRQNTRDQLALFKTYFDIDVLSSLKDIKTLEEIVYRRHMLVHCDGIATGVYCKQIARLGLDEPSVGDDISPSIDYLFNSWDEIFSTGAILSHLIAYQSLKDCARIEEMKLYGGQADTSLLSCSYMALERGRYSVVQRIGEYVRQRRLHNEWDQKAMHVNLALAYKQLKKEKEFLSVVNELDEQSCPSSFEAPLACLRGDFDKAFRIVKRECKQRDCLKANESVRQLVRWPVYAELRKTSKCDAFLKSEEMKLRISECEKINPKIDFRRKAPDPESALKELFTLCQEKAITS